MLGFSFLLAFISAFFVIYGLFGTHTEERPHLSRFEEPQQRRAPRKRHRTIVGKMLSRLALFNRPLCHNVVGRRLARDLGAAQLDITPEEFMLLKQVLIVFLFMAFFPRATQETLVFFILVIIGGGYYIPEFWLKTKVRKVKNAIIKQLPDTVDLLSLCVNAGLDFMLALKWVIDKSPPSILLNELSLILQEINVGKPRREALRDMAKKYELPDLSTFSRTLIQADRMGTSIGDALNILSEDMRMVRYRRGEKIALKAPLKLLAPLLLFIFPVVAILVGAPIILDFMSRSTMESMSILTGG